MRKLPPIGVGRTLSLVTVFQAMIRRRSPTDLDPRLERTKSSQVASFASSVVKDKAAVSAAITWPWSNGQAEGRSQS